VAAMRKGKTRKQENRREQAGELRERAERDESSVRKRESAAAETDAEARRARAEADSKRAEAERLEAEARDRGHEAAASRDDQHDQLRQADELDPDGNPRKDKRG